MTRCSSRQTSVVIASTNVSPCRASAETMAYDSSSGEVGRSLPASMRASTARVSRSGTSAGTAGFTGPCTVIR